MADMGSDHRSSLCMTKAFGQRLAACAAVIAMMGSSLIMGRAAAAPADVRPNVVLIVADDLGYGDLGCHGATKIKTPNIDRLAASGVRFTDAHSSAAFCQPSRYAILAGKYLMRAKRQGKQTLYFHEGEATLPSLMKTAGYRTAAIGKWHLGFGRTGDPDYNAELKPGPLEIGFDSFFGCPRTHNEPPFVFVENHRMVGYDPTDPIRIVPASDTKEGWGHGISLGARAAHEARPQDRIDLILADKAVDFISRKDLDPFFLYLAFLSPHIPLAPSPEFRGSSEAGGYGDFIQQLDACVGKVLKAIQDQGLAENTIVVFTSDNGAVYTGDVVAAHHRPNGSLLGQKTDAWEGGHRVPFIARWPGRIPQGETCQRLLCQTDLLTTICDATKVAVPAGAAEDSVSQLAVFRDPANAPAVRTEMLSQGAGGYALRQGDWLYLPKQGSVGFTLPNRKGWPGFAWIGNANSDIGDNGLIKPTAPPDQLYNLADDPQQKANVVHQHPERAAAMRSRLDELVPPPAVSPRGG
jgi:arylsulfatase A-like enzyme